MLVNIIEKFAKSSQLVSKLPEDKRIFLSYIASKSGFNEVIMEESFIEKSIDNSKPFKDDEDIKSNNNYDTNNDNDKYISHTLPNQHDSKPATVLTYVNSQSNDPTDLKLDTYLNNFYARKSNLATIPFKRLFENNYEFGTQKIVLKLDGDFIKGIFLS